ncbi:Ribonuclease Y [uncultured archaeon]|nr:Ribonuclease Y [uncultured archaeon]
MLSEEFFEKLKQSILPHFEETGGHEIEHTERVYRLCLTIAKTEKIDLDIIRAAALLHDIARKKQEEMNNTICHADEGAKMARELLTEVEFPKEKIDEVSYAIKVHRYSTKIKPDTKEAQILQDADRLDSLGATIIARCFAFNGKRNIRTYDPLIPPNKDHKDKQTTAVNFFYEKILKLKPETFNTKKGIEIAKLRYDFVQEFLERFIKEWKGEE